MPLRSILSILGSFLFCLTVANAADVRFNRDVRPILSARCSKCHGPDDANRKADLRLDEADGIRYAFDGGLDDSEGWQRLISEDADLVMPPADSHLELSDKERSLLRRWVEQGAAWEGHWSFIPPASSAVPEPDLNADWVRNPIDAFVLQRLQREQLTPNSDADKETLLRRVTLDLTGLPPTLEDIDVFLADESSNAYENAVDRLLQSPHFGERMAVVWMDAARYGDTSVFHADGPRDMWPWRDWVINAYNSNMPFDQFTTEQLAGDLLPEPTVDQKVATGFLRNNATTDEGGLIEEEYRVEYAVDRVKTTSMVWLGLSMECAQCHNHKYDPITQEEYYRFFAYFNQAADPGNQTRNGNQAPIVDIFDPDKTSEADRLGKSIAQLKQQMDARKVAAESEFLSWLTNASQNASSATVPADGLVTHLPLDEDKGRKVADAVQPGRIGKLKGPVEWKAGLFGNALQCNGRNFVDIADAGDFDGSHGFSYGAWLNGAVTGVPIARMNEGNGHRGYDLFLTGGTVAVHLIHSWPDNAVKVISKKKLDPDKWQHVFVTYDGSKKAAGINIYVNGERWEHQSETDQLKDAIRCATPFRLGGRSNGPTYKGLIDDVRVYDRVLSEAEVMSLASQSTVTPLLAKAPGDRSEEDVNTLRQHFLTTVDEPYRQLFQQHSDVAVRVAELRKPVVNVMVMNDVPEMRETFVLARGNYASPLTDRPVVPGIPAALPAVPDGSPGNRLGLARWITDPSHPLTARVAVNRYWAMLFGEGIVRSVEDFGAQGEWPTHPELLDWLAVDFVESGWDIKRALKQMVMSSTYRQSSATTATKQSSDPENQLFSRGARFRLQAEFVRDNALAAGGLLVNQVGGPGVKPYQPDGLWNEVSLDGNLRFVQDHGENLYRRSMYTYWKRSSPAPSMTIFDAPTREKCSMRRSRTNTPLQALVTLNDIQFVEASRALAELSLTNGGATVNDQVTYAFRRATGQRPSATVLKILVNAFDEERARFVGDGEAAEKLLSSGETQRTKSLDRATHAAMTVVASMILNLDQTLTRG